MKLRWLFVLATLVIPATAHADFYPYSPMEQIQAQQMMQLQAMNPQMALLGQMDPRAVQGMAISNIFNWNGAQPMGYSYLPPMGADAMMNQENWQNWSDSIGAR